MNCAECRELLVPYLEGLLDDSERQAVADHVKDCVACRTELEGLQTLQQRLVGRGKALAQGSVEDEVMNRIIREQNARLKSATLAGMALHLRRLIMRSSTAKAVAAAVVVLACLAALHLWRGTESGVVLADVLAKVERVQAFMYRMKMHMEGPIQNVASTNMDMEGTALIASEYGMRMDMHMVDPNKGIDMRQQMYMLPKQNMMIMLMPDMKRYVRMEIDETMVEKMRQRNNDPRLMIKQILACEYEELGRSEIDGIEAEGFRTTDSTYGGGMFGDVGITLWVDAKTWLPVRVEMNMKMNEQMQMQGTLYDFQWDVPVVAGEFDDVIPADFTAGPGDGVRIPAMNEETAIEGLRRAVTFIGRYPKNLDMMTLIETTGEFRKSETPEGQKFLEDLKGIASKEEKAARMAEAVMPIQAVGGFYAMLVQEQKDPAYYGDIVTPGDISQVLLRWKVSDDEYRVVFADLHADTVTAEQLTQLEAALPR